VAPDKEVCNPVKGVQHFNQSPKTLDRFFKVRAYLDKNDRGSVNRKRLKRYLADDFDAIRSEVSDFLIVFGGLEYTEIETALTNERSELVFPRLWVSLALADPEVSRQYLDRLATPKSRYLRAYFDTAKYIAFRSPYYLYDLCTIACSSDLAASHSAIDLLRLVAGNRLQLLEELTQDLESAGADNAKKAQEMLREVRQAHERAKQV
jgi:hypothetical protein